MKDLTFKILVKKISDGQYIAAAPSIPGCYIEAESEEEAIEEIQGQIGSSIKAMIAQNEEIVDDAHAAIYNLTIEFGEKPSA